MSKEAMEYLSTVYEIHPYEIIYSVIEGNNDGEYVSDIMQSYADQEVKPVQQELERWKYLYQTEFNKNKLKTE